MCAAIYVTIGQAAEITGISISTFRRWEDEGKFFPDFRTKGNHRRYSLNRLKKEILHLQTKDNNVSKKTYGYARVSSSDQKLDLLRQAKRLEQHCHQNGWNFEIISDQGSGLNFKKKGLNRLIKLICGQKISRLVLTHKDRLLRFGSPLLFKLCEYFNVEVVVLEKQLDKTFEQELAADVIEIITVFTAKMYGKRAHNNKNNIKECQNVVGE